MDAYFDDELDLVRSLEVERHMAECPSCDRLHSTRKSTRAAATQPALRFAPPRDLKMDVHAALKAQYRKEEPRPRLSPWRFVPTFAGALAMVFLVLWVLRSPGAGDARLEQAVIDAHVRSLMASHLTDVVSTDQHTVKPWFAGKLDFSPQVRDLSSDGFELAGGRLEYIDQHPAAALVYKRRQHVINVLVWPATGGDAAVRSDSRNGYNIAREVHGGMAYWLVSDLNRAELEQLAALLGR
jgi:anti-sigma factor RsiW